MVAIDEDALICDLAETYHIYDYKSLPCYKVAIFACGLRNDSRIKMKMNNTKLSLDTILAASAVDRLSLLVWMQTKDGAKGYNRPKSIVKMLCDNAEKRCETFDTAEEFENRRREIIEGRR